MVEGSPAQDEHPLRQTVWPEYEVCDDVFRIVDLFAGCGGLTLGVAQAVGDLGVTLEVPLAAELHPPAVETYRANFTKSGIKEADVVSMFPGEITRELSQEDEALRSSVGPIDALIGGPPCQGHSDLNNLTRRNDPKNQLYLRMARAAKVLNPDIVLIENVPTVQHDTTAVVRRVSTALIAMGYTVWSDVVRLVQLGVPQKRRRHLLLGLKPRYGDSRPVLERVTGAVGPVRSLRWAIEDLRGGPIERAVDKPPKASAANLERMEYMLRASKWDLPNDRRPPCHQNEHSYKSMYGRLRWDEPAQTITSGYGSIGQGRYMHPDLPRALTPHEAARLQGFPDYFEFPEHTLRADLADMIGNAVPPQLSERVFREILARKPGEEESYAT